MKTQFLVLFILLLVVQTTTGQPYHADTLKKKLAFATEDTARVNALWALGYAYVFSYPDSTEFYANQGIQLARKIGYKSGEGPCLGALTLASNFTGNYTNALDYGFRALSIFDDIKDTTNMTWTLIQIMTCYNALEDYDEALQYGYRAKKLLRLSGPKLSRMDLNQASVAFGVMGSAYEKKNLLDSALLYVRTAFNWDRSWNGVYQNIGNVQIKLGNIDSAIYYYRDGLRAAEQENANIGIISEYNSLAKAFELKGQTDSSIYYASRAVGRPSSQNIPQELLESAARLAKLYELRGRSDSSIKYLKLANDLKDSLYSRQKTREAQRFAFNELLRRQESDVQRKEEQNKTRTAALIAVIIVFLLIAFFLWRNNRQKQRINSLLQGKNAQIENTLNELRSAQAQLVQSEKMASLGELTAGIAHEIQNPLNFVNNFSDVNRELIEELKNEKSNLKSDEQVEILNDIDQNLEKISFHGRRADAIVRGMLQHSRTSSGQKELTDINALADEYLRLAYHGLRAKDKSFNAKLQTDFDPSVGNINIVAQDIGRVILNLINNAFYAINDKAKLQGASLPTPQGQADYDPQVIIQTKRMGGKTNGDRVEITVSDNGNGIPKNIVDKIFQPFFTTKPTGEGTGLGLSLAHEIVKAHGGELKVETKEGEGTKFIIVIPIT